MILSNRRTTVTFNKTNKISRSMLTDEFIYTPVNKRNPLRGTLKIRNCCLSYKEYKAINEGNIHFKRDEFCEIIFD